MHRRHFMFMASQAAMVSILLLGLAIPVAAQASAATTPGPYYTGASPMTPEERAWMDTNARKILKPTGRRKTLPTRVVNHMYLPSVRSQGQEGSCTHWAATYYYRTYQEAREHGWVHPDPAVNPERVMNHQFTYQFAGYPWQFFVDHGSATYATMQSYNTERWPTEAQWREAIPYRAKSIGEIDYSTADGLAALKEHLAGGDPAWVAMQIYNNFSTYPAGEGIDNEVYYNSQGGVYVPPDYSSPDHALTLIGYDDNKEYFDGVSTHKGAFLLVNSWGTGWGVTLPEVGTPGFIWIAYDYFQHSTWGVATIMEDRIGYKPTDFAVVEFSHGRLCELDAMILGGDRDKPDWRFHFLDMGGNRAVNGRLVVDLTDYPVRDTMTYWLEISDVDFPNLFTPPATGTFTYFAIERSDSPGPWVSTDTPVTSVETNIVYHNVFAHVGLLTNQGDFATNQGAGDGSHAWGDFDLDGDMDLVYCGQRDGGFVTRVLRNDGEDGFVDIHADLPGVAGQVQWGDVNGDGLLDLLVAGWNCDEAYNYTNLVQVYANLGWGVFAKIPNSFPAIWADGEWIDYDSDGDLDLALLDHTNYYVETGNTISIWSNDGKGVFTDTGIEIPAPEYGNGSLACADFDNDGDTDLAVNGSWYDPGWGMSNDEVHLWRNDGGTFTQMESLPGAFVGELAWGDADSDGWLDLAASAGGAVTIYRNDRAGGFASYATLPSVARYGCIRWGDMDNDGLADIVLTRDLDYPNYEVEVYLNKGGGTFLSTSPNVPGITQGNIQLIDLDQDGDLDMSVCGFQAPAPLKPTLVRVENRAAQRQGLGRVNAAPAIPAVTGESLSGGAWRLNWNPAEDAETSSPGLFYNVRAGSRPGWSDLIPGEPSSPLMGNRLRPTLPTGEPGFVMKKTPSQAFYWSVQAIDSGLRASAWSEPRLVRPAGATLPGDVNGDGKIDAADLVTCVNVVNGGEPPSPLLGDCNGDGKLNLIDLYHIRAALTGEAAPDMNVIAITKIGPAGGKLSADGFSFTIPAGAFTQTAELTLYSSSFDAPFGSSSASPCFHIGGLPSDFSKPIQVKVKATSATSDATVLGVGTMGYVESEAGFRRGFRPVEPVSASSGWFTFQIPASATGGTLRQVSSRAATLASPKFTLEIVDTWFGLGTSQVIMHGTKFDITFPISISAVEIYYMMDAFEKAYDTLKDTALYNFSYDGMTTGTIPVVVKDLGPNRYGAYFNPPGTALDCIEMNQKDVTTAARSVYQGTACHEFFHLVQALYTPGANMYYSLPYRSLWLDEACSVWSEQITVPGVIPTLFDQYITESFTGMIAGAKGKEQDHGYGLASLIKYFVDGKKDNQFPVKVYKQLRADKSTVEAIQSAGGETDFLWWIDYLESLIDGDLYGFNMTDVQKAAPSDRQYDLSSANLEGSKKFGCALPDLSGQLHMTKINRTGLPAGAVLSHRLRGGEKIMLSAFNAKAPVDISLNKRGVEANKGFKLDVPLDQFSPTGGWNILSLATNYNAVPPYTTVANCGLDIAVTWDRTYTLPSTTVEDTVWEGMPTMHMTAGTVKARGLTNISMSSSAGMAMFFSDGIGEPPINVEISTPFQVTKSSLTVPSWFPGDDDYQVWSTTGINYYLFDYVLHDALETTRQVTSTNGKFTLTVDDQAEFAGGAIYAYYDVLVEYYDGVNPTPTSTRTEVDQWMPVAYVGVTP